MAYYGTASAQEVVKWYQDHGELLFSRNIRGALVGTDVNDGIITTAREDLSRFWFFNNGVTVIAESFEQAPYVNQKSGNFNFRRANVINGAQTVSSLARASIESPSLLESADVFVRFVTLADPDGEFARLVTRRTNTQNRVGQGVRRARPAARTAADGVRGLRPPVRLPLREEVSDPSKGCDLTDATVALACAVGINETVLAKREISRMWEDTSRTPYLALFSPDVSGSYVWVAVELMRWADQALSMARDRYDGRERLIQGPGGCPDAARRRRAQPRRAQGVPRGLSCAAVQESVEVQGHRHQAPGLPLQGRRKEHLTRRFPQRGSE